MMLVLFDLDKRFRRNCQNSAAVRQVLICAVFCLSVFDQVRRIFCPTLEKENCSEFLVYIRDVFICCGWLREFKVTTKHQMTRLLNRYFGQWGKISLSMLL